MAIHVPINRAAIGLYDPRCSFKIDIILSLTVGNQGLVCACTSVGTPKKPQPVARKSWQIAGNQNLKAF